MKKLITPAGMLAVLLLLSGCVAAIGNRDGRHGEGTTLGQELIDLQKAKDSGAISPADYETQKAKLLQSK